MFIMSHVSQYTSLAPNIVKNIALLLVCIYALFTIGSLHATPTLQSPPQPTLNKATDTIFGNWIIDTSEHITLLQLNRDHSYLHIEFNLIEPQNCVAESGRLDMHPTGVHFIPSYSSNQQQDLVAYQIEFPKTQMALRVESKKLVFTIDTNDDNIADKRHDY
jgi:hypothetical protein